MLDELAGRCRQELSAVLAVPLTNPAVLCKLNHMGHTVCNRLASLGLTEGHPSPSQMMRAAAGSLAAHFPHAFLRQLNSYIDGNKPVCPLLIWA